MNDFDVLITFGVGLTGALVFGYLALRLKLSPIIGYLLAGIVVGPFTPGVVADYHIAEQFAEIGVILLLFGIGLHFNLSDLIAVWRVALPGAIIQSTLSTTALAVLLHLVGWTWTSGFILGMAISVASTVVMALVLAGSNDLHARIGHIAIGWTVVEDILTVALLLLLPILYGSSQSVEQSIPVVLGYAGLKIILLVLVVIVLALWVIPWIMERVARTRSRELFTLAVLVLAVGIAIGSAQLFGVSMALGAFLAGLAVGRSEFAARAANDALPMRDAFAVLFFVSVGMLFDPRSLINIPLIIGIVLLVVVVLKPLAAIFTVRLLGEPRNTSLPIGAAFSQVGEFSFILGSVALELNLITKDGWNALIAASIISIALNPYIYRKVRRLAFSKKPFSIDEVDAGSSRPAPDPNSCIMVGYGPVGKIVWKILHDRGAEITVIDLNLDSVRQLRDAGQNAIYGDVLRSETLKDAGLQTAGSLILSTPIEDAAGLIAQARLINPDLRILVRCNHLRDASALRRAGANVVAAGEAEVGVALAEAVLDFDPLNFAEAAANRDAIRRKLYDGEPA